MLTLHHVVQRDPDVISARSDQDVVMVSIESGSYYGVSNAARDIWEAIEQPVKVRDLVEMLTDLYSVDQAVCEAEILSFLNELQVEGLLQVQNETDR